MMTPAGPQHEWLKQFVGEWTCESECVMAPGEPTMRTTARESGRMLGDLWLILEGVGDMPGGGSMRYMFTIGFDPGRGKFVGSWVGSPIATLFVYEGELDPAQRKLPLNTAGPSMTDPSKAAAYQDTIELLPDGRRTLTSRMLGDDGQWVKFMTATYRRTS